MWWKNPTKKRKVLAKAVSVSLNFLKSLVQPLPEVNGLIESHLNIQSLKILETSQQNGHYLLGFFCCLKQLLESGDGNIFQSVVGLLLWYRLKYLTTTRGIAMKCCTNIHGYQRMNPNYLSNPLTCFWHGRRPKFSLTLWNIQTSTSRIGIISIHRFRVPSWSFSAPLWLNMTKSKVHLLLLINANYKEFIRIYIFGTENKTRHWKQSWKW